MSTATALTKQDLHVLHDVTQRAGLDPLRDKLATMIAERAGEQALGVMVLRLELPLDLAPTMNRYGSLQIWMRSRLYRAIDERIVLARGQHPRWPHGGRRRGVVVTRFSSAKVDETSVDVIGGKCPVDRLVLGGVLRGDREADLQRTARWQKAPPGLGRLRVDVHELVAEAA